MARRRTTGDMCALGVITESEYGVPEGKPLYCGTLRTLSDKTAVQREEVVECGQRSKTSLPTQYSTGFTANMILRGSADEQMATLKGWLSKAMGIEPNLMEYYPSAEIPSFTATAKVGPQEHQIWTGSKVDTLTLSQSAPGAFIQMQVDAVSKWHTFMDPSHSAQDEDGDEIAFILDHMAVVSPSGPPMNYARLAYDEIELRAQSWSLSVSNSLESDADASELYGSLAAGKDSTPTGSEITLEVTVPSMASSELDVLRRDKSIEVNPDDVVAIGFGSYAIVLRDVIVDPAGPDRTSESAYTEKVKITARGLYITKVGA